MLLGKHPGLKKGEAGIKKYLCMVFTDGRLLGGYLSTIPVLLGQSPLRRSRMVSQMPESSRRNHEKSECIAPDVVGSSGSCLDERVSTAAARSSQAFALLLMRYSSDGQLDLAVAVR